MILAFPFSTPYLQFYDMAILAVGLLYLALAAREKRWLKGERWLVMLAFVAVPAFWSLAAVSHLQFWPPLLLGTRLVYRPARAPARLSVRPPGRSRARSGACDPC